MLQGGDFHTFAEIRKNSYNEAAKEVCAMKKAIGIAVLAALIVSLSGCFDGERCGEGEQASPPYFALQKGMAITW